MPTYPFPEDQQPDVSSREIGGISVPSDPVPCYFLGLELEDVRVFKSRQKLSLKLADGRPARWTVLLGDNGMGKTTILQCLAGMRLKGKIVYRNEEETHWSAVWLLDQLEVAQTLRRMDAQRLVMEVECSYQDTLNLTPNTVRRIHVAISNNASESTAWEDGNSFEAYGYGALRRLGKGSLEDTRELDPCATLFDDEKTLLNADEWLREADYAAAKSDDLAAKDRLAKIIDLLKQLLPGVEDIRIEARGAKVPVPEAKTPFGWIPVRALSTGYRSVVAWVIDFASRLLDRYPQAQNPFHGSAIVLVDQIDLYLHPKWQRELMERLTRLFPNTQFIVTAHSPLIIQATPEANIAVLTREGNEVHIRNDHKDIRGWRTDQLLASELFEFQQTRDHATEELLSERRRLLEKHPRSPEEEARLTELEEQAAQVPEAESPWDIRAMQVIREAAEKSAHAK